jgi:hypothetical protein
MSLVSSIGDIITVRELAWSVYKSCEGTPECFGSIAHEVNTLHAILEEIEEIVREESLPVAKQNNLRSKSGGCTSVLTDIQDLVSRYERLGSDARRDWDTSKLWEEDSTRIKSRLTSNVIFLNRLTRLVSLVSICCVCIYVC